MTTSSEYRIRFVDGTYYLDKKYLETWETQNFTQFLNKVRQWRRDYQIDNSEVCE